MTQFELTDLPENNGAPRASAAELAELIVRYQQAYDIWKASNDIHERAQCAAVQRNYSQQLWDEISPDLMVIVRRWLRSEIAPDIETLAMSAFVPIVFALPKLTPDPSRNVRGLLLTIARRGLTDQYASGYAPAPTPDVTPPATDEADARMWINRAPYSTDPEAMLDPESVDADDRWLERIDRQTLLREVWRYWQTALKEIDLRIVQLRWQSDPMASFCDIAKQLGAGWSEAAVRQRHFRIVKETRKFLQMRGYTTEFDTG